MLSTLSGTCFCFQEWAQTLPDTTRRGDSRSRTSRCTSSGGGGRCQNSLVVRLKPARPGMFSDQPCPGASVARMTSQSCSKTGTPFLERKASLHRKRSALQASSMGTGAVTGAVRRLLASTLDVSGRPARTTFSALRGFPAREASCFSVGRVQANHS